MIIDTHAHLLSPQFDESPDQILQTCFADGISKIIDVGYDLEYSQKAVKFANQNQNVFASIGIHPHDSTTFNNETIIKFKELAKNKKVVAIGEIGLDYYRNLSPQDIQKIAFLEQFKLAQELNLPVIIHCRDAHSDLQKLLTGKNYKGVIHAFSGNVNDAKFYITRGFLLGIGGPITYKNNVKTKEIIKILGLENVILETDCPYLTPEPHRGKKNKPQYLKFIAEEISKILNISVDEVENITTHNAEKLFNI